MSRRHPHKIVHGRRVLDDLHVLAFGTRDAGREGQLRDRSRRIFEQPPLERGIAASAPRADMQTKTYERANVVSGWRQLLVRTDIEIAASPDDVFDLVSDSRNLPRFMRPLGPIPGVDRVEILPSREGELEHRYVHMSDSSQVEETVLVHDRPRLYRYRWLSRPKPPLHLLVRNAQTDWRCEPVAAGTRLLWDYEFELTSPLAYPAAFLFSKLFERWMKQGLARIKAAL